jgi:predicted peptidase
MNQNDELTHIPHTHVWDGGDWAVVFAPARLPDADIRPPYPILCFLHGHGEARTAPNGEACHPLGVAAHRSPAYHAQRGSEVTRPFLVVCPQRQERGRWTAQDAADVHALLDDVIVRYAGDADRIFLTGFSFGGDATLKFRHYGRGDRFQKLWAVDPAVDSDTPPLPGDRPLYIHHRGNIERGSRLDAYISTWDQQTAVRGGQCVNSQRDHVGTCVFAYQQAPVYRWLLA